jgi:hypothetical protein
MLTLRLWRTFIRASKRQTLRRVIAPDTLRLQFGRTYRVASFIGFFVWVLFPFILPPLIINFLCSRLTFKIAHAVSKQRELNQYDLLSVTPLGSFPFIIETCRAYLSFTHQEINHYLRSGLTTVLVTVALACVMPLMLSIAITNTGQELLSVFLAFLTVTSILFFWEYVQLATLAILLGILVGSSTNRVFAQSWAIGLLTGVQISLYGMWLSIVSLSAHTPMEIFLTFMIFSPLIFILREVVIYVVWRVLRYRFKDDIPMIFST